MGYCLLKLQCAGSTAGQRGVAQKGAGQVSGEYAISQSSVSSLSGALPVLPGVHAKQHGRYRCHGCWKTFTQSYDKEHAGDRFEDRDQRWRRGEIDITTGFSGGSDPTLLKKYTDRMTTISEAQDFYTADCRNVRPEALVSLWTLSHVPLKVFWTTSA